MTDGRDRAPGSFSVRTTLPWTELFRCFSVAIDPRKLLVAAAGILTMAVGWYLLSAAFYYKAPERNEPKYSNSVLLKEYEGKKKPDTGEPYKEVDVIEIGNQQYAADLAQWRVLADLSAPATSGSPATATSPGTPPTPPGRFRAMPWDEYRGPNPFLFLVEFLNSPASTWWEQIKWYVGTMAPVLMEPLAKFLLPIGKIVSPGVSGLTRLYLFFILIWSLVVWGFFGGIITRLAAVQLANKGPVTLRQTVRFVANRYLNYLLAPIVPLCIIGVVALGLMVYGLVALIPFVGDVFLFGLGLPLVILGGAIMAVFLVGLVGYPLMYPTLSVEGDSSDTFDALSRSINYVYQAPWQYIWYWFVTVLYGAAVTFFVLFFASLMVYVGKWAVGLPASAVWSERKPEYLFIYAPESFGWKELLLKDSPYEVKHVPEYSVAGRPAEVFVPTSPERDASNRSEYYVYNTFGARLVAFWLGLVFLMMLGFSYSFFWSAATVIYFQLRRKIDEAEPDEVFMEEEESEAPLAPPKIAPGTTPVPPTPASGTSLPVISPPVVPPPPPPLPIAGESSPSVPFPSPPSGNGERPA
jgi:hypothetical protein